MKKKGKGRPKKALASASEEAVDGGETVSGVCLYLLP